MVAACFHTAGCRRSCTPGAEPMSITKRVFLGLLAVLALPLAASAQSLPDLKGRKIVVVTENAYPPLQFVDPKDGKAIGWEYDAMNEIAKRLNFHGRISEHLLGRDDPGGRRQAVRHGHDRHHHQRRAQAEGRLLRPLYALRAVHAGARRRKPLHRRQDLRRIQGRPGRRAAGHDALLHRRLQRARRQRAEPAHQTVRDLRRHGGRRCRPATSTSC